MLIILYIVLSLFFVVYIDELSTLKECKIINWINIWLNIILITLIGTCILIEFGILKI